MSKFTALFKTPFGQVRKLTRRKPVTAWCLVLAAVLMCLTVIAEGIYYNDPDWYAGKANRFWDTAAEWTNQTAAVLLVFAIGAFFVESVLARVKGGRKALLLVPFFLLSAFLSWSVFGDDAVVFSDFFDSMQGPRAGYGLAAYCFILLLLTVYFCFRRSGEHFSKYVLRVFSQCVLCAAVYLVIVIGVLILFTMLEELLWKDAFDYENIPIILAGFLYPVAAGLNALDGDGEEPPKFIVSAVRYVALSLCAAAYVIVYVYAAKILITWTFPQNAVFSILSALFTVSMPVALMCLDAERRDLPHKAASLMPALFLPLIALQGLCMGMRVIQYGLTSDRYLGLALMVFELVYVLWAICRKGETQGTLIVLAGMLAVALCVPAASCVDLPAAMQVRTLRVADVEELGSYGENRVSRIGAALNDLNKKSTEERATYLKKHFSAEEQEKIALLQEIIPEKIRAGVKSRSNSYHYADIEPAFAVSVDGFKEISEFSIGMYSDYGSEEEIDPGRAELNIRRIGSYKEGLEPPSVTVDLKGLTEKLLETETNEEGSIPMDPYLPLPDGSTLYFTYFKYILSPAGVLIGINAEGYLLVP